MNSVHKLTTYTFKNHFKYYPPSYFGSPKLSYPIRLSNYNSVCCISHLPMHAACTTHLILLDLSTLIIVSGDKVSLIRISHSLHRNWYMPVKKLLIVLPNLERGDSSCAATSSSVNVFSTTSSTLAKFRSPLSSIEK